VIYGYCFGTESKIKHFSFYSESLQELRKLTVYFPENFKSENNYNVVFSTDGQFLNKKYKKKLDSIIGAKIISPFVIIGVNSNEKKVPDSYFEYRNFEYMEDMKSEDADLNSRFERHLDFFVNEVNRYVEKELDLRIDNRYFYGVSNGAGFGVSMSKYYPELFSKYILYSTCGENYKNLKWDLNNHPFFIIRYGLEEHEPLIESSKELSEYLMNNHYQHLLGSYNGGHSREDWMNLFIEDIREL
jgi:enterochelin esterase-like enzyme